MSHPWLLPSLLAALPSAVFVFGVYLYLYSKEGNKALLAWTFGWFFHLLFYIGNILQVGEFDHLHYYFPTLSVDFLRAFFQFYGCFLFLRKPVTLPMKGIFVLVGLGAITADYLKITSGFWVWPVYLLVGLSQIYTGIAFLNTTRFEAGKKITGWIFILWGIHVANYPFVRPLQEFAHFGFLLGGFFRFSSAITIILAYFEETKMGLLRAEGNYKKIVETTLEGIWLIDKDGKTTYMNRTMADYLGIGEKEFVGRTILDLIPLELHDIINRRLEDRKRGIGEVHDFHFKNRKGESVWLLMSTNPLFDYQGNYEGALAMCTDITAFKKTEIALKESERQLSTLIRNLPGIAYRCALDPNWTMEFISEGCFELTGYSPSDFVSNRTISFGEVIHEEDREDVYRDVIDAIRENLTYRLVYRIHHRNGNMKWVFEQGSAVKGEKGEIIALEGFISDFTQVKRAEEIMANSLQEKDILLKEVHHRVKNYLQVLSSLLSIQQEEIEESNPAQVLVESQNRILSMAYVHESLYGKHQISDEFFPEFVSKLVDSLLRSFGHDKEEIRIFVNCERLSIKQNFAIPIGLILNELVTNVLKHAFPGKLRSEERILKISFYQEGGWIHLDVTDNGRGKSASFESKDSMGLELVDLLTKQLKGSVQDLSNEQGTVTRIRFPAFQ
ncbi:PAS domain S-box protein [Leptospira langatensis]|uniref:histidine kinase n=1 Tax=Leptospira langatensis TaxID=2484983 RepID=A0A5F1ZW78_9LEPT|nr:PAS domain S-box protein [Leptospira langatensis]TGK00032.1 PAS domain S-box protein [Leptospira langatensis]TGL42667.1 PAS domain S-box protein [Leptospira langatensis]